MFYDCVFTPFINKYRMVENSPIANGSIIIEEIIALYWGKSNEIVVSIKYAKHPMIKKYPRILGMNRDLMINIPKGNNHKPQNIPTMKIPFSYKFKNNNASEFRWSKLNKFKKSAPLTRSSPATRFKVFIKKSESPQEQIQAYT